MTDDLEAYTAFQPLWNDINEFDNIPHKRPLLAHYTSIETLELIFNHNQIWFSNPLFMNDAEELRFIIDEGVNAFRRSSAVREALDHKKYIHLATALEHQYERFSSEHAFDIYVFCLSEHAPENKDGLLSMWRGYGGNGRGAAIVFDTSKLEYYPGISYLILSKVEYASRQDRLAWIEQKVNQFAKLLKDTPLPEDKLYQPAYQLFERFKMYALFTKHHGFSEEREWRVVYLAERDTNRIIHPMLDYSVGRHGIEPKLKFDIKHIEGLTPNDFSLEEIVANILLGPSLSSKLAISSVRRMLTKQNKFELALRLTASETPYRP